MMEAATAGGGWLSHTTDNGTFVYFHPAWGWWQISNSHTDVLLGVQTILAAPSGVRYAASRRISVENLAVSSRSRAEEAARLLEETQPTFDTLKRLVEWANIHYPLRNQIKTLAGVETTICYAADSEGRTICQLSSPFGCFFAEDVFTGSDNNSPVLLGEGVTSNGLVVYRVQDGQPWLEVTNSAATVPVELVAAELEEAVKVKPWLEAINEYATRQTY